MSKEQALATNDCVYLAENLHARPLVVIDFDGDHDNTINEDLINFGWELGRKTAGHILYKQATTPAGIPVSFHLTYSTDRVIPTLHFRDAKIDILGNARPTLRYYKTKAILHTGITQLTDAVLDEITTYIKHNQLQS
jgi:hypothetical protein